MIDTDQTSVHEDIGYRGRAMDDQQPKPYRLKKYDKLEKWKIERIKGELRGQIVWMREDFAKDLIGRGWARRIS